MDLNSLRNLIESERIHHYLSIISFLISIIIIVISFFKKNEDETNNNLLRIAGALLVCSMSFLIHSQYIYFLSIFIIATFITKLDFLENLAAIFKGNKEFWEYRMKSTESIASKQDTDKKLEEDRKEIIQFENTENLNLTNHENNNLVNIKLFEQKALTKLREIDLLSKSKFRTNVKISYQNGFSLILDAVIKTNSFDYLIEVKMLKNKLGILNALKKLSNYIQIYDKHLTYLGKHKFISGILIVPNEADVTSESDSINTFILKYDFEQDILTNIEEFRSWFIEEMFK